MKIATLLFTYHRSRHTEQVLTALRRSKVLPQKLFVFQDGLKMNEDRTEWNKVNCLIKEIDWCDTEIIVSEYNKGLAASIVEGISYVFREYDAIIVLEDDCVPEIAFMNFMQQALEKYQNNENVFSLSGFAFPVSLKKGPHDIYGCGRISSYGWGTWKDRWKYFEKDYELTRKMRQEQEASRNLAVWGSDLENTLLGNIKGDCNSWAVFWALTVIARKGICLNPYESLIRNIGMDGSGEHSGVTDFYDTKRMEQEKEIFDLPDEIEISDDTIRAYTPLFGSYTAMNRDDDEKKKILVYGIGNYYLENEQEICEKHYVQAFVDRKKHEWFAGKRIIKKNMIMDYTYDFILVMIRDPKECMRVAEDLKKRNVETGKIIMGHDFLKRK